MKKIIIKQSITNVDDSLTRYFADIRRIPLLDEAEERRLILRLPEQEAKDKLVTSNLRFVVSIAKQYQQQGLGLLDLIALGNAGLIRACDYYDPKFGVRFLSYAGWWIKQAIVQGLNEDVKLIAIPNVVRSAFTKVRKVFEEFYKTEGREPSKDEVMEKTGISSSMYDRAITCLNNYSSVDSPIGHDEDDDRTLLSILPNTEKRIDSVMDQNDSKAIIDTYIAELPWNERTVIKLLFGFGCKQKTIIETAKELELSPERIRQLRDSAFKKIKRKIKDNGL